jgi:hypothetical protein
MQSNQMIENSSNIYAALLGLYPKEYRTDYAQPMRQVFTDQCRSAYQERGFFGIIWLWLRTLLDLGYTALLEHFASPSASWGLMEPVPNAPLPWKGIFLILLPGLVYLVSQIAQLTGQPWYLTVYYRGAFLLIIPVIIVWVITRRFPIWGLIPLGLLFRLVQEIGYQLIVVHSGVFSSNIYLNTVLEIAKWIQADPLILVGVFTIVTVLLGIRFLRQQRAAHSFWIWLGVYLALAVFQIGSELQWLFEYVQKNSYVLSRGEIWDAIRSSITWSLYDLSALLLLIFIGTLFSRRHGFFTILIMVGYILPSMLVGFPYDLDTLPNPAFVLTMISIAVLAYRSILSLIAPIWMSRTPSQNGKKRVIITSIAIALGIHAVMQFFYAIFYPNYGYINTQWIFSVLFEEGKLISAFLLAFAMVQDNPPHSAIPQVQLADYKTRPKYSEQSGF